MNVNVNGVLLSVSPEHKELEKALMNLVESLGFKVGCSSSHGPKKCDGIGGITPDLRAYSSSQRLYLYGEAEIEDTLNTEHTKNQIKVFGNCLMPSSNKPCPFYLAVPEGSKATAEKVLKDIKYDKKPNIYIVEF